MIKRMWYELNILALRKHVRPVSLFLLVHTLLWCDLTWLVCQIGCTFLRGGFACMRETAEGVKNYFQRPEKNDTMGER